MGKYLFYCIAAFCAASFACGDVAYKFGTGARKWSYSGKGVAEMLENSMKFSADSAKPFMHSRITVNPGESYEISATGSGACDLALTPDKSPSDAALKFAPSFRDIFKNGEFKTVVKIPRECPERIRVDLHASDKSFEIRTLSVRQIAPAGGFVRDRQKQKALLPTPAVARGVAAFSDISKAAKVHANIAEISFADAKSALAAAKKAGDAAKSGVRALMSYSSKDGNFDISVLKAALSSNPQVYAWSIADADMPRGDFARRLAEFRKLAPDAWVVYKCSAKSLDTLEPFAEYRVIYSPKISERADIERVRIFRNAVAAPVLVRAGIGFVPYVEGLNVSWLADSLPTGKSGDFARRLLVKNASKAAQLENLKNAYLASPHDGCLNFAFASDTHFLSNKKNPRAAGATGAEHMRDMAQTAKELKLDFVCNGGDLVQGIKPKARSIADMREIVSAMETSGLPVVVSIGNHDDGVFYFLRTKTPDDSQIVNGAEWHDACVATALKSGAVGDENFPKANYFYIDFPTSKIRLINIAVSENPMEVGADGKIKIDSCGLYDITQRQLDWLAHKALDFSAKADAPEWGVVFVMHTRIASPNTKLFDGVVKAFREGGKFSGETRTGNFPSKVSCDFSGRGKMDVLAFFEGHEHADEILTSPHNCPRVRVLNDKNRPEFPDSAPRNFGEADDAAWSIVSVDRKRNEFRILRFGAGVDFSGKLLEDK